VVSAGLGVEERVQQLKIAPAIRYTRRVANASYVTGGQLPNQVELVVGFFVLIRRTGYGPLRWMS
jgi:hypothetical protein